MTRRMQRAPNLIMALLLVGTATACRTTGAVPRPFPTATAPPAPPEPTAIAAGPLLETALGLRGTPYRRGGADVAGFDCSGFTQYVFGRHGIVLPREVRDQIRIGVSVRGSDVRPGDLLFFATESSGVSHVAIAMGDDVFVHAPSSTGVVRVERRSTPYWARRFIGARRVL
jgi:cell wall-associated NlpC family hydrolase